MVEPIGRSQPTVSHHLKILAEAGRIVGEKRGSVGLVPNGPRKMAYLRGVLA